MSLAPPARAPIVPVRITDPGDPRLSDYAALRDPALRRDGLFVVESWLAVEQLLVGRRHRVRSLLATDAALTSLGDALGATTPAPTVYLADAAIVRHVAGYPFHRGCLATAERGPEASLEAILPALPRGPGILVALDDVANPDNVGGLFRTAAAFGAGAVLLSPGSADPLYRKAIRAGMGASLRLAWTRVAPWPGGLRALRRAGWTIVALVPDGEDVDRFMPPGNRRIALVAGAEGNGVSQATRALCDATIGIPMRPGADSLNVTVAAGIALHRLARAV